MATSKDFTIRGAIRPCTIPCLTDWECADITAETRNWATFSYVYCGIGKKRRLHSVLEQNPPDGTMTIRVTEEYMREVITPLAMNSCHTVLQRVHCSGWGEHYRMVGFSSAASGTQLTAQGLNVTDEALVRDLTVAYRDVVHWGLAADSHPSLYVTEYGRYYQAPTGPINGTNTVFYLDPVPYDDPEFGRPVLVFLDGDLQVEGVDYTREGGVITFTVAPECPVEGLDGYLLVLWYSKEYLIYGKKPIAVWFCDSPSCGYGNGACGGPCSDGCKWVHALFESDVLTDPDVCGTNQARRYAIIATFNLIDNVISFIDADVLKDAGIAGPVDGLCAEICDEQGSVIATDTLIWEGTGLDWLDSLAPLPAGAAVKKLAHSNYTGYTYGLFGNQGVLRRTASGWRVIRRDVVGAESHTVIDAAGQLVVTGGGTSIAYSTDNGVRWANVGIPLGETVLDVGIGIAHELNTHTGVIYLLTTNGTRTTLWLTENYGSTWLNRKSWATTPVCHAQLEVAVDDWFIYVHIDGHTYRNTNYGCSQCKAWEDLGDDAPCDSILAVCHHKPDETVVIGAKYAAVDDFFIVPNTGATLLDVLFNDVSLPPGCIIDPTTVTVTVDFNNAAGVPEVTGEIEITPAAAPTGYDLATYTVDADCPDSTTQTFTATVIVLYTA